MRLTRSYHLIGFLVAALTAVVLNASPARAQGYEGKFTLPFEAQWGRAVLPPGEYTFHRVLTADGQVIGVRGEKAEAVVIADAGVWPGKVEGPSYMIAVRVNGKYRIRTLQLAGAGLTLDYTIPKPARQFVAQEPVLIRRVPVTMTGK